MNITLKQALAAQPAFRQLAEIAFNAQVSYRLGRIGAAVSAELEQYEATRLALIKRLGTANDDGTYTIPKEKIEEYQAEMDRLHSTRVEFWGRPLTLAELGDKEIPVSVFEQAFWLFEEPEGEKTADTSAAVA